MNKLLQRFWPVIFIVTIWFIFSSPYFIKGLVPFPSRYLVTFFPPWSAAYGMPIKNSAMPDVITQIYPWKKLTIETWKKWEIPLWNPYSFSGTTHAANYQTAVFSPVNFLFFILPMIDAWSISVLLQPLLAGLFMYIFLRELGLSKEAGTVGSISFMFCGFMVVWMAYATLGFAALWTPLILTFVHRQFRKDSWWNLVLLSVSLALSFLSGHFQISLYVLEVTIFYLLFLSVTTKKIRIGFQLFLMIIGGLLLASPQILPSIVVYHESLRSTIFEKSQGIPWYYLVTFFAPDYFGNPVTRNDWLGSYAEWAAFMGTVPVLLAIFTLFPKNKKPEQIFFVLLAVIGLLLATPNPLNQLLYALKIPVFSTSAANRIIIIVSFSAAALSAYGFDNLINLWQKKDHKLVIRFGLAMLVFIAVLWLITLKGTFITSDKMLIAKRNIFLPTILAFSFVTLTFAGFVKKSFVRKIIPLILIVIVAYDLLRFSGKWMPFDSKEFVFPPTGVGNFLQQKAGNERVFGNIFNEFTGYNFLQSIVGYDAVYQRRYGEFISAATEAKIGIPERSVVNIDKHGKNTQKLLEFLGVKYLVQRLSDGRFGWAYPYWDYPFYTSVYKDNYYEVLENTRALPRTFLASSYKIENQDQKIIDILLSSDINLKDTLILEKQPIFEPQQGKGIVDITDYQANHVTLSVDSQVPKLLFLSDVYDPGWQVTIDGKISPLYRADFDFRAVPVTAGKHIVRFAYNPLSFRLGVMFASLAAIILIIGSLVQLKSSYENRFL